MIAPLAVFVIQADHNEWVSTFHLTLQMMKVYFEHMYEHIGYLFYALATEHGKLNGVTLEKLIRLIDQQWYPPDNGTTIESHLASHLHSGVRKAFDTSMPAFEAFDYFKSYFDIHGDPYGQPLRSKMFATANTIAAEFSGNGKKSDLLPTLKMLLEANRIALSGTRLPS